jgi:tetratricopeptide (TPR) repeat protein
MFLISASLLAQIEPQEVASADEQFQEAYYESLVQKGIENYDKAIDSLEKCKELQPENAVIYHELGRNYYFRKDFLNAENSFRKASELDPKNKWYLIGLYDVYYETKNFVQAVNQAQKIILIDKSYNEDLVSLYMFTQQYDKALVLLNLLDEQVGKTELRNRYRKEITSQSNAKVSDKNDLENTIQANPLIEENYLSLISLYSNNNQEEKSRRVVEKLLLNIPNSEWAHVFLFKYLVNDNQGDSAFNSLEIVLKSNTIDKKIKFKMFNEFLIFTTKNPVFEPKLNQAISYFEKDAEINVFKEIGLFYYKKQQFDLAIKNLEKAGNEDFESNISLLLSYQQLNKFDRLQSKASELLDSFPNQPEYYLLAGKASHLLKEYAKSLDFLESGMDYVVENKKLEIDFLNQLILVAKAMGNLKKADEYSAIANKLKKN